MNLKNYHCQWIASIALLAGLTLSSCTQEANVPVTNNSPNSPTSETTSPSPSVDGNTASPSPSDKATSEKLGVSPQANNCPSNAPIKGRNTKKRGKVYTGPKAKNYDKIKPDICFPSRKIAEQAGYKSPKELKENEAN
ncbi:MULTISPECIES: hypothetical protein [Cyanophyceae]|uniref:sunset domain-containing protein n=1 Tax=Cyanophyceae TaxID=3028117 RepID=UPI0016869FE1|nr:hypothetical protein [Trichocoleus sp. FACHB-69]MBD1930974.1 hypothetical protein [Trichocoleus sp. FACHB-69]